MSAMFTIKVSSRRGMRKTVRSGLVGLKQIGLLNRVKWLGPCTADIQIRDKDLESAMAVAMAISALDGVRHATVADVTP